MAPLFSPCESCERHIRVGEAACPFCGAAVGAVASVATGGSSARPLSRAALLFTSATVVAACGSSAPVPVYGPATIPDAGPPDATADAGALDATTDSGAPGLTTDAGTPDDAAMDSSGFGVPGDGAPVPVYGPSPLPEEK